MFDSFLHQFMVIGTALGQVLLVVVFGGIMVRYKYLHNDWLKGLAAMTVNVFTPALIATKIIKGLKPDEMPYWWMIPLASAILILIGIALAYLFFWNQFREKAQLLSIAAIQNANFLILPMGLLLYPKEFDTFAAYVFLVVLGVSPILWSVGRFLVSPRHDTKFNWKEFLSPPFISNFVGIAIVLLGLSSYLPAFLFTPIEMMGDAAVPSMNLILGASLGSITIAGLPSIWDILRVNVIKFIFMPIITLLLLWVSQLHTHNLLLAELAVIQAASAPASSLMVLSRNYGGDWQKLGAHMFVSYVLVLFFMPFWLALARFFWTSPMFN